MASDSGTAKLHGSTATAIEKSKLVVGKFYRPKVYMPNLEWEEGRGRGLFFGDFPSDVNDKDNIFVENCERLTEKEGLLRKIFLTLTLTAVKNIFSCLKATVFSNVTIVSDCNCQTWKLYYFFLIADRGNNPLFLYFDSRQNSFLILTWFK